MASICEYPRQGYTEPPTTTTTVLPEAKCPSDGWNKYNEHCYRLDMSRDGLKAGMVIKIKHTSLIYYPLQFFNI